jgi:hypothetical protein
MKKKNGTRIEPTFKKEISEKYISVINSRTASVRIATPELTAIDLMTYMKRVGGISTASTVLAELVESIDFSKIEADFFYGVTASAVQRLGFLLEEVLNESAVAEGLYVKAKQSGVSFKATPLVTDSSNHSTVFSRSRKWDIAVNYRVESDI